MNFTDTEIQNMIDLSIVSATQELTDNGKSLNVECDHKNGDKDKANSFTDKIDTNNFETTSHNRLKTILEIS